MLLQKLLKLLRVDLSDYVELVIEKYEPLDRHKICELTSIPWTTVFDNIVTNSNIGSDEFGVGVGRPGTYYYIKDE